MLSAISEALTIIGFYLASIAYGLFYQAGVVHAAEASLSQLLNLAIAYVLLRGFGIGRASAVGGMRVKLVSFVMVTIGLFLCTLEEGPPAAAAPQLAMPATAPLRQLPGLGDEDAPAPVRSGSWSHGATALLTSSTRSLLS